MQVECRCCSNPTAYLWPGKLLSKDVDYYECRRCGYVQTESPYWLDEAYSNPINDSDTGIVVRNQGNVSVVLVTLFLMGKLNARVIDCAGGYGLLVRMLRDLGVNAEWHDPYCENLISSGFDYQEGRADLVTAFEAFEHFEFPGVEIKKLLNIADTILLSTSLIPRPTPKLDEWWYYGVEHGQHIGFFRRESLEFLASEQGLHLLSDGVNFHLLSRDKISELKWRTMLQYRRLLHQILKRKLRSKTWEDHLSRVKFGGPS